MTNAQRRSAQRNRRPAKPRFTPENFQLDLKLRELDEARRAALADERRTANLVRAVPTGGPQRRRTKARARIQTAAWGDFALSHLWVQIDPSIRVHDNQTYVEAGDDVFEAGDVGVQLVAFESESHLGWVATIAGVEDDRVYLDVDWTNVNHVTNALFEGAGHAMLHKLRVALNDALDAGSRVVDGLPDLTTAIERFTTATSAAVVAARGRLEEKTA